MGFDDDQCEEVNIVAWSKLHEDIQRLILKKFTSVSDCLRFGVVCVSWRNLLVSHLHPGLLHPQLPLLLIPTPPSETEKQTRSFYSISEKRIYKDIEINLPYNRHCRGSSHGWLITSGEDRTSAVELINPLVSINNEYLKIKLPPLTALPDDPDHDFYTFDYFFKAILSANPLTNPKNYVVMAIYGGYYRLAYWKPGEEVWNPVSWTGDGAVNKEIIYHEGLYYICNSQGNVFVCDLGSVGSSSSNHNEPHRPITVRKIASSPTPRRPGGIEKYLVKLSPSGDLLMLHRFQTIERPRGKVVSPHSTLSFSVFKLLVEDKEKFPNDEEEEKEKEEGIFSNNWELMISDLENHVFFVGDNAFMSLKALEFSGGKPSHIYFTCDNMYGNKGYLT